MNTEKVKFYNTNSNSWNSLKNNLSPVISYKVYVNNSTLNITTNNQRFETRLDKHSRDLSHFEISNIDYESGIADIIFNVDNASTDQIEILKNKNTRLFINSLIVDENITAITGFTACVTDKLLN